MSYVGCTVLYSNELNKFDGISYDHRMIRSCDRKRSDLGRASLAHLGVAEHVRDFERVVTTRESADHAYEGSTHPRQAHFPHRARPVPRPGAGATSSLQRPHTFVQARILFRQMAHRGLRRLDTFSTALLTRDGHVSMPFPRLAFEARRKG